MDVLSRSDLVTWHLKMYRQILHSCSRVLGFDKLDEATIDGNYSTLLQDGDHKHLYKRPAFLGALLHRKLSAIMYGINLFLTIDLASTSSAYVVQRREMEFGLHTKGPVLDLCHLDSTSSSDVTPEASEITTGAHAAQL